MKGKQKGRPTKWVIASVQEAIHVGKPGVQFEVWQKWKQKDRKLGTLTVSVGGLRWLPGSGKFERRVSWKKFASWYSPDATNET